MRRDQVASTLIGAKAITFTVVRRRLDAATAALAAAGIDPATVPMYEPAHNVPAEGERAATWLLTQSPRPTALLCQSDQLAIGALAAAARSGLRVPGDVSIAGFDDIEAAAETNPPLTTVHQPLRERGRRAGELMLELLGGGRPRQVRLPTELVVRASTARAPTMRHRRRQGTSATAPCRLPQAASTALIAQACPSSGSSTASCSRHP